MFCIYERQNKLIKANEKSEFSIENKLYNNYGKWKVLAILSNNSQKNKEIEREKEKARAR